MVYDYVVYIKNERAVYINILSQLLCLMSAVFFILQQIKTGNGYYIPTIIAGIIIFTLVYNRFRSYKKLHSNSGYVPYGRLLALVGFTWLSMPFLHWLVAPFLLLAVIEKHAKSPLEIGLSTDWIVFNSIIKRKYPWTAFSNVVLKDGLLTIDFKNNKLFQKEITDDTNDLTAFEFNEYCRKQLLTVIPGLP